MDSLGVGYIWDSQVGVGSSRQSWELLSGGSQQFGSRRDRWNSQVGVGTLRWWEVGVGSGRSGSRVGSWEWKSELSGEWKSGVRNGSGVGSGEWKSGVGSGSRELGMGRELAVGVEVGLGVGWELAVGVGVKV